MLPSLPVNSVAERLALYAKLGCQVAYTVLVVLRACSLGVPLTGSQHVCRLQLGVTRLLSFGPKVPTLGYAVKEIVTLRSEEKMIGSHAWRVITLVEDEETFWDRSAVDLPRDTVGWLELTIPSEEAVGQTPLAVALRANPNPTACTLLYLLPKAVGDTHTRKYITQGRRTMSPRQCSALTTGASSKSDPVVHVN